MVDYEQEYDAVHRESISDSGSDTIEMTNLEEVIVTPNPQKTPQYPPQYENDSEDEDDEGQMALLGPENRTRGKERSSEGDVSSIWSQTRSIVIEAAPTLLFTTIGLLLTGELLNSVQHWKAMSRVDELIMIIPVVLNLKGNLEMNLSARLGTAANMGELDKPAARKGLILGNLSLLQVQATVVSFVAACVAFLLGRIISNPQLESLPPLPSNGTVITLPNNGTADGMLESRSFVFLRSLHESRRPRPVLPQVSPSGATEFIMTASSAMASACLSSVILGSFMCTLVVVCRKLGLDPDNIAPPIASCLGDLVTLCLLGIVSSIHIALVDTPFPVIIIILLVLSAVGWTIVTRRNPYVKHLLTEGWVPLFAAMVISTGTGIVLDTFVSRYDGFALLAVVISGLPGSAGSIFVSRLSTVLHAASRTLANLPVSTDDLSKPSRPAPSSRLVIITLLCITFPVELIFLGVLSALGWLRLPIVFLVFSVLFFCVAVFTSLMLAKYLTTYLWNRNLDPDMYALPIHSALVDLISQLLLVLCFEIVSLLGVKVKTIPSG